MTDAQEAEFQKRWAQVTNLMQLDEDNCVMQDIKSRWLDVLELVDATYGGRTDKLLCGKAIDFIEYCDPMFTYEFCVEHGFYEEQNNHDHSKILIHNW